MHATQIVKQLKEANQDLEFYPTTPEMVRAITTRNHRCDCGSILDIGAGDGRVLKMLQTAFKETKNYTPTLYSIEKAEILRNLQSPDIITLGADFHEQTLIDKSVDIVFCNPPYSEYELWAERVIKEANANKAFLVMPQRWANSERLKRAIEAHKATATVLWSGNFHDAERAARAVVDVVEIDYTDSWRRRQTDPFDLWFEEFFPEFEVAEPVPEEKTKQWRNELVVGKSRVEHLCECYRHEMNKLCENYRAVGQIDAELLKELGIAKSGIKASLKEKITRLKSIYWNELINRLEAITSRLTSSTRDKLLNKIQRNLTIDFTEQNVFAVVLWMVRNANVYINEQLLDVFRELSCPKNVIAYKSNQRTFQKDQWRYTQNTHYSLDYRIILTCGTAIRREGSSYYYTKELSNYCHKSINDIITIANTLGFASSDTSLDRFWESGKTQAFYLNNGTLLMDVKAFKNGNLHIRLCPDVIKAINIEAGRLLGWINNPTQASDEMGVSQTEAEKYFISVYKFGSNVKQLCG